MEKTKDIFTEKDIDKQRNSNFELMRIVSMLMIVVWHFILHGGVLQNSDGLTKILLDVIHAIFFVHVNSFVLLSGYFNYNKVMRLGKAIKLNNSVWFYSSIILLIFIISGTEISKVTLLHTLLPISYSDYWFFTCYLILFLISPILNIVIKNSDKTTMKKIIFTCFVLLSLLPFITQNAFYNVNNGFSLSNFVLLYFIGAYLRKYPITECYFMRIFTKNTKKLVFLFLFFLMASLNFLLNYFGTNIQDSNNGFANSIGSIFTVGFLAYDNPLLIIQSICYLLFFSTLDFKSKFINKVAASTFGVYLITDNFYVRGWLYNFLGFNKDIYRYDILFYIAVCALTVFIICIIIETIRLFIFKVIYNSKLAKKNRIWYQGYFKSLGLNINW